MTGSLLYLVGFPILCLPGLPVGFRLFGRRHATGWIAGALFGYVAACLAVWAAMRIGGPFPLVCIAIWALLGVLAFAALRWRQPPLLDPGAWTRRDSAALGAVLALAVIIAIIPIRRIGERDATGAAQYRAYFTADFLWHTALTAELTTGTLPPRNPYLAAQPIHYYWTYFLVPAAVARAAPAPLNSVQATLKGNALGCGLLFVAAIFVTAHAAARRAGAAAIATALALVASSAEGAYELWRLWTSGLPLSALRGINVDALTAWYFYGHRIDGLQRCLWYVPQHSTAYALGLVALTAGALGANRPATVRTSVLTGCALGGAVLMNPFVGGLFALAWGGAVAIQSVRRGNALREVAIYATAAIPVLVAAAWCVANRMVEGAGGALVFGWGGASVHAPLWNLLLSLGPALVPAACVAVVRPGREAWRRLLPALCLAAVALFVMHLVRLDVDEPWVPFRAGQMLLAVVPALIACAIVARPRPGLAVVVVALGIGLPTTLIDTYNAQDVSERGSGAGFHWTLVLSREEQQALKWIRLYTPRTAIVQMEPTSRDREHSAGGWGEHWSVIPSLAERRMAAGLPISLLRIPAYEERSQQVRRIFESADPVEAYASARALRIEYLYVDAKDRAAFAGTAKFDADRDHFELVCQLGDVRVYRLR